MALVGACEGPEGPIGPQGSQGPQGANGFDGADGQDGVDGENGTDGQDGVPGNNYLDFFADFGDFGDGFEEFTTSGDASWSVGETAVPQLGTTSNNKFAISGDITHNQASSMHIDVNNEIRSTIEFEVWISSEVNYDFLTWYVNGEFAGGISGIGGPIIRRFQIPPGNHEITWTYHKDETVSEGDDRALIDNVFITNYERGSREGEESLPDGVVVINELNETRRKRKPK